MVEDKVARLVRELQAQENQLARGRQTRGRNNAFMPKLKSRTRKKSSEKVEASDDSDVDTKDSSTPKKRKAGNDSRRISIEATPLQELASAERVCAITDCLYSIQIFFYY